MKPIHRIASILILGCSLAAIAPAAPAEDTAYMQAIQTRAEKIVATLGISDAAKAARVRDAITRFYRDLNGLQDDRDARLKTAKENAPLSDQARDAEVKAIKADTDARRGAVHNAFLARLAKELPADQIDRIKDGLTYDKVHVMLAAYERLLPNLTAEQRAQMRAWLIEAREQAMDGFTSDEKHAAFGKYKGRINNYLAKAGYNIKEAEKALSNQK